MALLEIRMPALGQSVAEGTVMEWLKRPGDDVQVDESLVAISSDKAESEVPSPASGVLESVDVAAGETVPVGTVLARLQTKAVVKTGRQDEGAAQDSAAQDSAAQDSAAQDSAAQDSAAQDSAAQDSAAQDSAAQDAAAQGRGSVPAAASSVDLGARGPSGFLSPAVRKLAREKGLGLEDLLGVEGSGRGGRVTHRDVSAWIARRAEEGSAVRGSGAQLPGASATGSSAATSAALPASPASPASATSATSPATSGGGAPWTEEGTTVVPMTGLRLKIAQHMVEAKRTAAHVNTVAEADFSRILAARAAFGPAFEQRHGFNLSINAFLLKASAEALRAWPQVNAVLEERGIVQHRSVHLGMAVALEPSGLVVPVIRHAERMSVRELSVESTRLAAAARARTLSADDMAGGTCTVTNPGVFGNLFGTPILHVPQAAIIDFGAIKKRVIVTDDDAIAIRPMAYVVLAWDHRVMDGATAARFLQCLVRELESVPTDSIDHRA